MRVTPMTDMAATLRDEMGRGRFSAVLHCFTASAELAATGLDLDLYISFSGVVTFKNSAGAYETSPGTVPLDRMLVETDAPFLAPMPFPRENATSPPMWPIRLACWRTSKASTSEALRRSDEP